MASRKTVELKSHHKKSSVCASRPKYREARWERAIKVYTINLESKYLLVQGIPKLDITKDLLEMFAIYGVIEEYRILDDYPAEEFTSVYWIKFRHIMAARKAKRKLDNRSFFGGILHVSYAPEFETVDETKEKLMDRKRVVERKLRQARQESKDEHGSTGQRSHEGDPIIPKMHPTSTSNNTQWRPADKETKRDEVFQANSQHSQVPTRLQPLLPTPMYSSQVPTLSTSWNPPQTSSTCVIPSYDRQQTVSRVETRISQDPKLNQKDCSQSERVSTKRKKPTNCPVVDAKEMVGHSHPSDSLTWDSSLDRTVLSIRDKLNQIKNTRLSAVYSNNISAAELTNKSGIEERLVPNDGPKKKQRKRI